MFSKFRLLRGDDRFHYSQAIWFTIVFAMIAILFGVAHSVIPSRFANTLISAYIYERANEWYKAGADIHLFEALDFYNPEIQQRDREFIAQLADVSGISNVMLFNHDLEFLWSSQPAEVAEIPEHIRLEVARKDFVRDANPFVFLQTEVHETDINIPQSAQVERLYAEALVPYNYEGRTIGFVKLHFHITEIYGWFQRNIAFGIRVSGVLCLLALAIAGSANTFGAYRAYRKMTRNRAKDESAKSQVLRQKNELESFAALSEWLQAARTLDEFFRIVSTFMQRMFPALAGELYIVESGSGSLHLARFWNAENKGMVHIKSDHCWAIRRGRLFRYENNQLNFRCAHAENGDDNGYICIPITAHGETLGMLHLRPATGMHAKNDQGIDQRPTEISQSEQAQAVLCAEQISMSLSNAMLRERLEEQTIRDPMTGLYNRRGFMRDFDSLAAKMSGQFSLVSLDIDHFKKFNDNFGHDAGDAVINAVAGQLQKFSKDHAFRLGGEEFAMIMEGTDDGDLFEALEVLRMDVSNMRVRCGELTLPQVTISMGVAMAPRHGHGCDQLLRKSDQALYEAKTDGRNMVKFYPTGRGLNVVSEVRQIENKNAD